MHHLFEIHSNPKITGLYTAFRQSFGPEFRFKGESHDFWELLCVTDGAISVAADNNVFTLTRGQSILHNPMQFHNITALGNTNSSIAVFSFSGENIPPLQNKVFEIGDISRVKQLLELSKKYFVFRRSSIVDVANTGPEHLIYVKQLELFLLELASREENIKQKHSRSAENYSLIVKTINENVGLRLSVKELATLCNMSEINLKKTFSHYAGVGVMEYFNRIKMQKAGQLLQQGLSVKEAALQVGFLDQNYFSTAFKRITGKSPCRVGVSSTPKATAGK